MGKKSRAWRDSNSTTWSSEGMRSTTMLQTLPRVMLTTISYQIWTLISFLPYTWHCENFTFSYFLIPRPGFEPSSVVLQHLEEPSKDAFRLSYCSHSRHRAYLANTNWRIYSEKQSHIGKKRLPAGSQATPLEWNEWRKFKRPLLIFRLLLEAWRPIFNKSSLCFFRMKRLSDFLLKEERFEVIM